jgi:hypothetical protein
MRAILLFCLTTWGGGTVRANALDLGSSKGANTPFIGSNPILPARRQKYRGRVVEWIQQASVEDSSAGSIPAAPIVKVLTIIARLSRRNIAVYKLVNSESLMLFSPYLYSIMTQIVKVFVKVLVCQRDNYQTIIYSG